MASGRGSSISTATALGFQGGIGVVGLGLVWWLGIPLKLNGLATAEALLLGALGAGLTYLLLLLISKVPGLFPDDLGRQMRGLYRFARSYSWPALIALSVLAGVGEELLFRGAVQGLALEYLPPWAAVLGAALLFGLVHYVSFTYFVMATGLGLVMGTAYQASGSLTLVMVWHAVYDMIAIYCLLTFPHWFGVSARP